MGKSRILAAVSHTNPGNRTVDRLLDPNRFAWADFHQTRAGWTFSKEILDI
jgi:hypothetical protein